MYPITDTIRKAEIELLNLIKAEAADLLPATEIVTNEEDLHKYTNLEMSISTGTLLLGQTCGYPLHNFYFDQLNVVAVPKYNSDGCQDETYSSVIISNRADFKMTECSRIAINSKCSMSGNLLLEWFAGPNQFERTYTGSHRASIQMISEGKADVAAIDCHTFSLLHQNFPDIMSGVHIIGYT